MMKLVLLAVVIAIAWWMLTTRKRKPRVPPGKPGASAREAKPATMLACAHCGVHLPESEAVTDAAGKSFCTEAHRLAGPR